MPPATYSAILPPPPPSPAPQLQDRAVRKEKKVKRERKEKKSRRKDDKEVCETGALPRGRSPSASVGVPVDQTLQRHGKSSVHGNPLGLIPSCTVGPRPL